MGFVELDIKDLYITDSDCIPDDFYRIVLPNTVLYKRAAGFFSSSALVTLGLGLKEFYNNGGNIRLLVSPNFSQEDYEAIELGYNAQNDIVCQRILESFDFEKIAKDEGTNILAWLIYEKRLEIRVVVKKKKDKRAIFHDKFSILIDEDENRITYRGSMNESKTAMVDNYESIEVDCSWVRAGSKRAFQREQQFDQIWSNEGKNWETISIPQAICDKLVSIRKPFEQDILDSQNDILSEQEDILPSVPEELIIRPYQKKAIAAWIKNGNCGIFEMATGTGKTKTSITAITKILNVYYLNGMRCGLVIVVPYKVLLEQWINDLKDFDIYAFPCYESKKRWEKRVSDSVILFNQGITNKLFLITTNRTFVSTTFQTVLANIKSDFIFCADEMHHLTSQRMRESLPMNARYRLGLSATLMTKYNTENMNELIAYFGGVIYHYSMKEAIENNYITRYYYYPVFMELTDSEKSDYFDLSERIGKRMVMSKGDFDSDDICLTALLNQRARIVASADNKLIKLREMKEIFKQNDNILVYCGDKIEANIRFIDKVYAILQDEMKVECAKFTAKENQEQREILLKLFKQKIVKVLAAIRCLDEGIDIPQLERAFILSSGTNPKEFIQRRGRILRNSPGKKYAYIYDFIVIPTMDKNEIANMSMEQRHIETKIIGREYERLIEFADLSENGLEARGKFMDMWNLYAGGEIYE